VKAGLCGSSRGICELFQKNFSCRLVIYRFAGLDKNPHLRTVLGSLTIPLPSVIGDKPVFASFELSQVLDSSAPGQNFSIGKGLGVAIEVEKTSDGTLDLSAGRAFLLVESAVLRFNSRTINDKVMV
jgi:hypothetical protein